MRMNEEISTVMVISKESRWTDLQIDDMKIEQVD